jgi:hypothetical protein
MGGSKAAADIETDAVIQLPSSPERVNEFETVVGGFYVAFEPASLSSVSWLLGDGCWVMAAR